jgi:hypothetical protein
VEQAAKQQMYRPNPQSAIGLWIRRNTGLIALVVLIVVSLIIALRQ